MGNYKVNSNVYTAILNFYKGVFHKYSHTYSFEMMQHNIEESVKSITQIGNGKFGKSILQNKISQVVPNPINGVQYKVQKCSVRTIQWHFIYYVENDTIYIVNAIHGQNMKDHITENFDPKNSPEIQAILDLEQRMNSL